MLVTDSLPFMGHFDGSPLIQPILFKSAIYWVCVLIVRMAEEFIHFAAAGGAVADFSDLPSLLVFVGALFVNSDMVDGAVSCIRHNTRTQRTPRRR